MDYAKRVHNIPPYLFAKLEQIISELKKQNKELISLSIGDPDLAPPLVIRKAIADFALMETTHNYSSSQGENEFREAIVRFMKNRFNVDISIENVCSLLGSKEGLANIARVYLNPNDQALVPDPAYPVYQQGATILCDSIPVIFPLHEENEFLPDLSSLKFDKKRTKMLYLNYPNNPTGAVATKKFMKELADFCDDNDIIVCYDNAYSELTFDNYRAESLLQYTDNAIEFFSLSKMFCMTGSRIGFAVGREDIIKGLIKVKSNIDSGNPIYLQKAAIVGLDLYKQNSIPKEVELIKKEYARRRNYFVKALNKLGFHVNLPKGTFYLWVRLKEEDGNSSEEFVKKCIEKGVLFVPGRGYGNNGEGYFRVALTQPMDKLQRAIELLSQ
ncbi:MAG: aminotransferase class I/II-fold pyridoxal phosphate-dependent enzyme [Candidatus Micrarchaeota archaeon]|nr:aminotransferase class I/II-fold pyridoxal phosphate-dependent enzyme [Candidatus Micrarchaeota archaeon]